MFSTEQPVNWENMNGKVLRIMVGKESSDKEEAVVVVGWERETDTYYVLHTETKGICK